MENNKLITEYPFREAIRIYVATWKRLFLAAIKSLVVVGLIFVAVQLFGSLLLGFTLRLISSTFWGTLSFLLEHRIAVGGSIVLLAVIFVVLRTAKTSNPAKW